MAKKKTDAANAAAEEAVKTEETVETAEKVENIENTAAETSELDKTKEDLKNEHDNYLRLAAEYDNFRKRSQKEREGLFIDAKADAVAAFLPVFDNLQRALEQETTDTAYKKGVEMTMSGLREIMEKLGVKEYGSAGDPFDPALYNAVMHTEDETLGENTVAEVFQKGFRVGEKVVRFAMVKVAN